MAQHGKGYPLEARLLTNCFLGIQLFLGSKLLHRGLARSGSGLAKSRVETVGTLCSPGLIIGLLAVADGPAGAQRGGSLDSILP